MLLAVCLAGVLFTGCGSAQKHTATDYTYFDTVTTIIGYDTTARFDEACTIVWDVLNAYHRASDIYHEYSGINNACTLNQNAGGGAMEIPEELMELLTFGKTMESETGGMCNIAMGAVLSLWHDCRESAENGGESQLPEEDALLAAAEHCSIDDLVLDEAAGTAELRDAEMSIDLGSIAKGYAVEAAAKALEEAGYTGYAISAGGNVRTVGTKPSGDWVAGIQNPDTESAESYVLRVSLSDASLVTSGVYQRYYTVDGVRYHHIISPETLAPKNEFLSVTIRCGDSGRADALSTAVFNMEFEDGLNYVNQLDDVEACWIFADGTLHYSDGFASYVIED